MDQIDKKITDDLWALSAIEVNYRLLYTSLVLRHHNFLVTRLNIDIEFCSYVF